VNGNILIVDDDEDTAVLLRDSLRKRGFDVDAVTSGQAALEHLRTSPADVVVTDVQMAGISGIELCQELRQRHPDLLPIDELTQKYDYTARYPTEFFEGVVVELPRRRVIRQS
jgi:DNA-binding response OmpR family regulator